MATPIWIDVFIDPYAERGWMLRPLLERLFAEDECLKPHLYLLPPAPGLGARAIKAAASLGSACELDLLMALWPLVQAGRSIDEIETLVEAARAAGISEDAFRQALMLPVLDANLDQDHVTARESGVDTTPTLVLRNDAGGRVAVSALRNYALLKQAIDALRAEPLQADAGIETSLTATPIMPEVAQLQPDQAPTG